MLSVLLRYTDYDNVNTFRHTTTYNKQIFPILCWAFGLLAAKYFYIIWLSTVLIMNVPYEIGEHYGIGTLPEHLSSHHLSMGSVLPSGTPELTPFVYGLRASFRNTRAHTICLWAPCFLPEHLSLHHFSMGSVLPNL